MLKGILRSLYGFCVLRKLVSVLIVSLGLLAGQPAVAGSSCDAERLLVAVAQSYKQMLTGERDERMHAAYHLKSLVPFLHAGWISRQLEGENAISPERLERFLDVIAANSEAEITGQTLTSLAPSDVLFLERLANGACSDADHNDMGLDQAQKNRGTDAGEGAAKKPSAGKPALGQGSGFSMLAALNVKPDTKAIVNWMMIAGVTISSAVGSYLFFRTTRQFRLGREKRHPRKPFSARFGVLLRGAETEASGVDISVRGMKFSMEFEEENMPEIGLPLKLLLPIGELGATLVWSNAHFAGVIFDRRLEDSELARLLVHESATSAVKM